MSHPGNSKTRLLDLGPPLLAIAIGLALLFMALIEVYYGLSKVRSTLPTAVAYSAAAIAVIVFDGFVAVLLYRLLLGGGAETSPYEARTWLGWTFTLGTGSLILMVAIGFLMVIFAVI